MTREEAKQTILIKSKSYESAHQNYIHLLSLHKIIDDIFDDHEALLKAKDEEMDKLKCRAYHAEGYISDLHNEYPKNKKFLDKKARSIVAMLFWEWKKAKIYTNSTLYEYDRGITEGLRYSFQKGYKVLKESK